MVLLTMVLTKYTIIEALGFSSLNNSSFFFLSILVLLITASGYVINDILDVEVDKINKPEKVYISNVISIKNGWILYSILTFFTSIIAFYFSTKPIHYLFFFGSPLLLFSYSKYLKKTFLLGNITISILASLPIYMVYLLDFVPFKSSIPTFNDPIKYSIYYYVIFAFTTTLIREIIKDIEDIDGDLKINAKTLPILFGRKRAAKVAFLFTCILLVLLLIMLQVLINEYLFLGYGIIFILLPLLYFMYKLWFAETKRNFSKLSNQMKIIMLFGILSMLLFTIQ